MEKLLIKPDDSGYSVSENSGAVAVAVLDGGCYRTRLDEIGGSRIISLQWSGSRKRYQTVRDFLDLNLGLDCAQFLYDLIVNKSTYEEHVCNVIPDSIRSQTPAGLTWLISAQFEALPRDDETTSWPMFVDGQPKTLIYEPDQASYSISDPSNRIIANYGLAGVHRRNLINSDKQVGVSWQADGPMYDYLAQCYRSCVASGGEPFLMNAFISGTKLALYQCRFVQGSFSLASQQGGVFNVTAQLRVKPADYDVVNKSWISDTGLSRLVASVESGFFFLTGYDAILRPSTLHFGPNTGLFTYLGRTANLSKNLVTNQLDGGSFSLTGNDILLSRNRILKAIPGSFGVTGNDATLTEA